MDHGTQFTQLTELVNCSSRISFTRAMLGIALICALLVGWLSRALRTRQHNIGHNVCCVIMYVCLSVRLSVTIRYCVKMQNSLLYYRNSNSFSTCYPQHNIISYNLWADRRVAAFKILGFDAVGIVAVPSASEYKISSIMNDISQKCGDKTIISKRLAFNFAGFGLKPLTQVGNHDFFMCWIGEARGGSESGFSLKSVKA